MAARIPRRTFATPFVMTLAACSSANTPPPTARPSDPPVVANPPRPGSDDQATPPVIANPPPPGAEPDKKPPTVVTNPPRPTTVDYEREWTVTKTKGECSAFLATACPKVPAGQPVPPCNPPPPVKYACQDWIGEGGSRTIKQHANQTACLLWPEPMSCPKGAMCNPPPPREVACPSS